MSNSTSSPGKDAARTRRASPGHDANGASVQARRLAAVIL